MVLVIMPIHSLSMYRQSFPIQIFLRARKPDIPALSLVVFPCLSSPSFFLLTRYIPTFSLSCQKNGYCLHLMRLFRSLLSSLKKSSLCFVFVQGISSFFYKTTSLQARYNFSRMCLLLMLTTGQAAYAQYISQERFFSPLSLKIYYIEYEY